MKLKTVRNIFSIFCVVDVLLMCLLCFNESLLCLCIMIALTVVLGVISFKYWRCPQCGKWLGWAKQSCKHCGEKLDLQ